MRIFFITFLLFFQIQYIDCSQFKHDLGALIPQALFLGVTALTNYPSLKTMPMPSVQIASLLISGSFGIITGSIENKMKKSGTYDLSTCILTLRGILKIMEIGALIGIDALVLGFICQLTDKKYFLETGYYIAFTQVANIVLLYMFKKYN